MYKPKGAKGKCDVLFSKIVRATGYCENCGSTSNLQCAHIISRRYSATRCDPQNAFCLCAKCHFFYTAWPLEFSKFIVDKKGSLVYDKLKATAETVTKMDWEVELNKLQHIYAFIGD